MKPKPSLKMEVSWWQAGQQFVAGVDEVGRGCLAGPVMAAAVVFPVGFHSFAGVFDSKQLTARQRALVLPEICRRALRIGIGQVAASDIDRMGIVAAVGLAMLKACQVVAPDGIIVDGPTGFRLTTITPTVQPVIKGDQQVFSVAAASIVAKEFRDRLMHRLAIQYPDYGWMTNVGYGTKVHQDALRNLGPTPYHRLSFIS